MTSMYAPSVTSSPSSLRRELHTECFGIDKSVLISITQLLSALCDTSVSDPAILVTCTPSGVDFNNRLPAHHIYGAALQQQTKCLKALFSSKSWHDRGTVYFLMLKTKNNTTGTATASSPLFCPPQDVESLV